MIAWERSRAARGYGIIWGGGGGGKRSSKQTWRNLVRKVIVWIVVVTGSFLKRATDSNKIEVIVSDDQRSRELRRIRTTCSAVNLYDVVNKYA